MADILTLGLSPCPNDTFIFHALLHGLIKNSFEINPIFSDVEDLNLRALNGELAITKVSVGVLPEVLDKYIILNSGGALGFGCGPLVVARKEIPENEWKKAKVAIPGKLTTANLLLSLHGGFADKREELVFSDIIPSVVNKNFDIGVIIHEGRFTYMDSGLIKLLDLGAWWEDKFNFPLPLGVIIIRKDIPNKIAKIIQNLISESIEYAWENPEKSVEFIKYHAQEMDDKIIDAHIKTFVTKFSKDLGFEGRNAIEGLIVKAFDLNNKKIELNEIFLS